MPAPIHALDILIVDDHAPTRAVVSAMLRSAGATTLREASDGEEALALLAARPADLVITDHMMAGLDGLSLIEALHGQKTKTVLMTGYADVGPGKANAVLTKPIEAPALLRAIEAALA